MMCWQRPCEVVAPLAAGSGPGLAARRALRTPAGCAFDVWSIPSNDLHGALSRVCACTARRTNSRRQRGMPLGVACIWACVAAAWPHARPTLHLPTTSMWAGEPQSQVCMAAGSVAPLHSVLLHRPRLEPRGCFGCFRRRVLPAPPRLQLIGAVQTQQQRAHRLITYAVPRRLLLNALAGPACKQLFCAVTAAGGVACSSPSGLPACPPGWPGALGRSKPEEFAIASHFTRRRCRCLWKALSGRLRGGQSPSPAANPPPGSQPMLSASQNAHSRRWHSGSGAVRCTDF
jgi:hypothetical protein